MQHLRPVENNETLYRGNEKLERFGFLLLLFLLQTVIKINRTRYASTVNGISNYKRITITITIKLFRVCLCVFCRILLAQLLSCKFMVHIFVFFTILHWNLLVFISLLSLLFVMFGIVHGHGTCFTRKASTNGDTK